MSVAAETFAQFGRSAALGSLSLSPDGRGAVSIESMGDLLFETDGELARISLSRSAPYLSAPQMERALELCHPSFRRPEPLRIGLARNGALAFFVEATDADVTPPMFDRTLRLLADCHDRVAEAS